MKNQIANNITTGHPKNAHYVTPDSTSETNANQIIPNALIVQEDQKTIRVRSERASAFRTKYRSPQH
jgi:hypothetical protein